MWCVNFRVYWFLRNTLNMYSHLRITYAIFRCSQCLGTTLNKPKLFLWVIVFNLSTSYNPKSLTKCRNVYLTFMLPSHIRMMTKESAGVFIDFKLKLQYNQSHKTKWGFVDLICLLHVLCTGACKFCSTKIVIPVKIFQFNKFFMLELHRNLSKCNIIREDICIASLSLNPKSSNVLSKID